MKLAGVTFQNLFPSINVQTTRLSSCQVRRPRAGCMPRVCIATGRRWTAWLGAAGAGPGMRR